MTTDDEWTDFLRNKKVVEFDEVPKDPELVYSPMERVAKLMSDVSDTDDIDNVLPTDDVIIYIRRSLQKENILER